MRARFSGRKGELALTLTIALMAVVSIPDLFVSGCFHDLSLFSAASATTFIRLHYSQSRSLRLNGYMVVVKTGRLIKTVFLSKSHTE